MMRNPNVKLLLLFVSGITFLLFLAFLILEKSHSKNTASQIEHALQYSLAKADDLALYNTIGLYSAFDTIGCIRLFRHNKEVLFLKKNYCNNIFSDEYSLKNSSNSEFYLSIKIFPSYITKIQFFILSLIVLTLLTIIFILLDSRRRRIQFEIQNKLQTEISRWRETCEEKDLVCRQIHHDLASPLGLLKISTQKLGEQPLTKSFALALDRLGKIAQDLQSQKYIWASENYTLSMIESTLSAVLHEKRLLTTNLKIEFNVNANDRALKKTPDIPDNQLLRVLSNILNNAIDALKGQGQIKILVRSSLRNIIIVISDNGPGVPKEMATLIFDKLTTFNKSHGSGLGLYHAKKCIESFGGELRLLNTDRFRRHGAVFLIKLPTIEDI